MREGLVVGSLFCFKPCLFVCPDLISSCHELCYDELKNKIKRETKKLPVAHLASEKIKSNFFKRADGANKPHRVECSPTTSLLPR